jgi:glycosyltransferase involved in cell wall biosynthesis
MLAVSTRKTLREKAREITHLTTVHPALDARIFHKECKSIARAGYDVTLIACHDRDEMIEGVRIRALPKAHGRLSRMIWGAWGIYREAVRQDADLYHFHDPELLPVGLLLRMRGKTVVYDVHEDVSADVAAKHYVPRVLRRPLAWTVSTIESLSSKLFSGVVAATAPISQRFVQGQCQVVVSNYPMLQEFHTTASPVWHRRSLAVGYVGVLARDRCLPELIYAMSLLPAQLQATLKLAGNFSPSTLREELAGAKGWDRTCVMGILDRPGVTGLLADVRAGLVVLKPTPAYLESAPVKMFEYMAAGIPVIASDFPGFREIVEGARCGLLVQPDDPVGIAGAIEFILTHPEEAEEMGKRGQEAVVRQYNWASEERKLLDLYRILLDSPCVEIGRAHV